MPLAQLPPRFPQLWTHDAPPLRLPDASWLDGIRLAGRAGTWHRQKVAVRPAHASFAVAPPAWPPTAASDASTPALLWAERIRLEYTRGFSGSATTKLARDLQERMARRVSLQGMGDELWDGWWASGVLPGDLPPLDPATLGPLGTLVGQGLSLLQRPEANFPLCTPQDLLELQVPLALLARRRGVAASDPVARVWLGAWAPARASQSQVQHQAVDLSRARYILATTGWPVASQEEAALHLCQIWAQTHRPGGRADPIAPPADVDPWLVALAPGAGAAQRAEMLAVLAQSPQQRPTEGVRPTWALELASLLAAADGERLARQWVRSPDQRWREAGLALLTQVRGVAPVAGASPAAARPAPGRG